MRGFFYLVAHMECARSIHSSLLQDQLQQSRQTEHGKYGAEKIRIQALLTNIA